jgi:hypothetical protein
MNYLEVILKYYPGVGFAVGDTYASLEWSENEYPKPSEEELQEKWDEMKEEYDLNLLRMERDELLKKSDMYALQDFPHKTSEIKEAWFNYRQALRDFPSIWTPGIHFPQKPT